MHRPYSHCPRCGGRLSEAEGWPRRCGACDRYSYLSPAPAGVVLQPVDDGVLLIQRGIPPHRGAWALPGGFIDAHEGWREGVARELFEETGVVTAPDSLTLFSVESAPEDNMLLIFAVAPPLTASALPAFVANKECRARRVATAPEELAFVLHTAAVRRFLA